MDATLLVYLKPSLHLPDTLFSTLFPEFLLKINTFTMRYEIWKGRKKKFGKGRDQTQVENMMTHDLPDVPLELIF